MQAGWRIIPLHRVGPDGTTCSCREGAGCKNAGKHPKNLSWSKAEPMSAPDVYETWGGDTPPNIGTVTGEPSGIWVLDLDPDAGGIASFTKLVGAHEKLPKTLRHKTGSGGYHLIFSLPAGFRPKSMSNALGDEYPGIDVRGVGGQIVLPPSRSSKGPYAVAYEGAPLPAPEWLTDLIPQVSETPTKSTAPGASATPLELDEEDLAEYDALSGVDRGVVDRYIDAAVRGVVRDLLALPRPWHEGAGWDQGVHRAACRLYELAQQSWSSLTYRDAYEVLELNAPTDDQWGVAQLDAKWQSAMSTVGRKPMPRPRGAERDADMEAWGFDEVALRPKAAGDTSSPVTFTAVPAIRKRTWDDFGNAERLNDRYPGIIRWIEEREGWAYYDGSTWRFDAVNHVPNLARKTLETLAKTESHLYSEEIPEPPAGEKPAKLSERDQFLAFAAKQRMNARLEAMLKVAKTLPAHSARVSDFDANPMVLNCRNSAVDLHTGAPIPHHPDLMLMHQAAVDYDPDAPAPRWQAFLDRVLPDPEMQAFLARSVGYTINGLTGEQVMFIHHGSGANGKSVFLRVMEEILGDYSQTVPRTTLLTQKNESVPTDIARMVGKRFLQTSETAAGRRLDEEVVKGLTGGEKQTARFLHKDFFDFTPTGTIHYVTNHLPRLTNAESIWRRIILFAWGVVIPPEERDPDLADRIIAEEAAGVLAWAIRGAQEYQRKRLAIPEDCRLALEQYREDVDLLGDFIKTCLVTELDESVVTPVSRIYDAYTAWCFRSGIRQPMVINDLSATLAERGFKRPGKDGRKFVEGKQQRCFLGIGVSVNTSYADVDGGIRP